MEGWIYVHDLNPIIFTLGPLKVGWYGLMYAISFLTGYRYLLVSSRKPWSPVTEEEVPNLLTYVILGVIIGARVGWVFFYGGSEYLVAPWRILETWKGGMSFHGGLLGFVLALYIYARRHQNTLLRLADFVLVWVPMGLFLGRIGNFINGELYGMPTSGTWGVVFPGDAAQVPRHPSQLYEGVLEGLLIFAVLYAMRGRFSKPGHMPAAFLSIYGVMRTAVEFVRLPDAHLGYQLGTDWITRGMILSLPILLVGLFWIFALTQPWYNPAPLPPKPGPPPQKEPKSKGKKKRRN